MVDFREAMENDDRQGSLLKAAVGDPIARAQTLVDHLTGFVEHALPGDKGMIAQLIVTVGDPQIEDGVPTLKESLMVFAIVDGFDDENKKHESMQRIGALVARKRLIPLAVGMSCEAWMVAEDDLPEGCQPRHAAAKKEVAMISCMAAGADKGLFKHAEMVRDSEQVVTLGAWEQDEMDSSGFNLLIHFFRGFTTASMKIMLGQDIGEDDAFTEMNSPEDLGNTTPESN